MERKIVKSAIYSLIGSFLLLFAVMPREKSITDFDGMSSIEIIPYSDFFFMIALYSVRITLGVLILSGFVYFAQENEKKTSVKT
ncbi:hypothetical protein [Sporosarcina obsidiansis]|uniref:hypothetical protein n=1 Tax=Sporosarcina obsidiansis TaxID=2660748 RepID=UPI00129AAA62|nr:hypothetical protein [Sporosarcina obsidiansis]